MRGHSLATPGRDVPGVKVHWPDGGGNSFYRGPWPGDNGAISVKTDHAFNEAVVMHEYGHHVLQHFGESPIPDYNNGICDSVRFLVFGGHCFWHGEKGDVAWTEGWPNYLAEVLTTTLGKNNTASSSFGRDVIVTSAVGSVESPPHPHPHESPSPPPPDQSPDKIEGYVAAVLWDLHDGAADVHGPNASRDRLAQGFATQWDVLVNFDPDPVDPNHNKVRNIHELWRGIATRHPDLTNRASEIYDVNHISEQAADLHVPFVADPPAAVNRGGTFSMEDTTANMGSVRTGVSFGTRYHLSLDQTFGPGDTAMATRTVPNLQPGQESRGSATAVVPATMAVDRYYVLACADAALEVFETNEANNCRSSGTRVEVMSATQPPPALTSLTVGPTSVVGGSTPTGTVTLAGPAPSGGVVVTLSDNSAASSPPVTVTVAQGSPSATFAIGTSAVAGDTPVTVSATANGVTRTASLTVRAARPSSVTLTSSAVDGPDRVSGTVRLDGPAPAGGLAVALSSSNPAVATVAVPSVTVPAGGTSASFDVDAAAVDQDTQVTISASAVGVTRTAVLTVRYWEPVVDECPPRPRFCP